MWKRLLFTGLAMVCLLLAIAGVLLPGLPTTPFLLLASYLLVRSNPAMNDRLLRSPVFGPILHDWQERGGVQQHVRIKAAAFVVLAVGLTVYFGGFSTRMVTGVLCSAGVGLLVIWRLPKAK